jgi:hypothetical protein
VPQKANGFEQTSIAQERDETYGEMLNVPEVLVSALATENHFQASFVRAAKDAVLSIDRWGSKRLFLHSNKSLEVLDHLIWLDPNQVLLGRGRSRHESAPTFFGKLGIIRDITEGWQWWFWALDRTNHRSYR